MRLVQHLSGHDLTFAEFGRVINASRNAVRRWTLPQGDQARRVPSQDLMVKIYVATNGEVTPNDFYDLPDLAPVAAPEEVAA